MLRPLQRESDFHWTLCSSWKEKKRRFHERFCVRSSLCVDKSGLIRLINDTVGTTQKRDRKVERIKEIAI